jgi:sporulation protein YlmC with PRC-barrel domain
VVPLSKVASFGDEVRLTLSASELAGFDLFGAPSLKPMPDHGPMPAGFDLRSFFLVKDPDAPEGVLEPAIAASTPVYDKAGQRIGDVESMEIDPASGRITRVIVRRGVIFRNETAIPARVIASVGDRITLSVGADEVKKLECPLVGEPGPAHSR